MPLFYSSMKTIGIGGSSGISDSDIFCQLAISCAVCIGITLWWLWRRCYPINIHKINHHSHLISNFNYTSMNNVDDVVDHDVGGGSEGAAAADDDVKCNDPNCLRCQSFSQRHIQAFHSNVVLLRRLVKLEPHIFDGMREEIWSVIEDKLLSSSSSSSSSTSAMLMSRGQ